MSNIERMYAVPSSPFSFSPAEVAQAREDLAHAEREAASATTWSHRTRAEQEAKSLRARLRGAEIQQRVEAQHEAVNRARPTTMTFQAAIERGVAEGRYAPCRPYYVEQATAAPTASETELEKLQAEAKQLQAVVDNPATPQTVRVKAEQRLTVVRLRLEQLEVALHPVIADVTKAVNALVAKSKPKRMCVGNKAELLK